MGSWDHLTTKGLIHEVPDRVLVWNDAQKQEAIALHDVPAERVGVTGAQAYDHWFAARPSLDRAAFCTKVGLGSQRPFLLYLCSSPFIAPHEVELRAPMDHGHPQERRHPPARGGHSGATASAERRTVAATWISPPNSRASHCGRRSGVNPIGGVARADYFDSIYHCEGVVGVNTSAMIESGIIGRPVYSVTVDEFAATQEGTLHFQHLKNAEGGLLHLAGDLDAHLAQLAALFANPDAARQGARQFIQAFIRPHGLDVPATPRVVEHIEAIAAAPALGATAPSARIRLLRMVLLPAAVGATVMTMERQKLRSMVLHWTRPARLRLRGLMARLVYTARFAQKDARAGAAADGRRHPPHRDPACAVGDQSRQNRTPRLPCLAQRRTGPGAIDTVRLLFSMRHLGSLRMYESVLRALAAGGHDIEILANRRDTIGSGIDPEHLLADLPQIRWSWEDLRPHAWTELAAAVRIWLDYLRYFEPRYADAPRLRQRVGEYVPPLLRRITTWSPFRAQRRPQGPGCVAPRRRARPAASA